MARPRPRRAGAGHRGAQQACVAGTIATLLITFIGPSASDLVKLFQPADYFALMVLAFTSVGALIRRSALRGLISVMLGLFVGLIGFDVINGQVRYVFGQPQLQGGLQRRPPRRRVVRCRRDAARRRPPRHRRRGDCFGPRPGVAESRQPEPVVETVVARDSTRVPIWECCRPAAPRCRRFSPTASRNGSRSIVTSSVTGRSKGWPGLKRPTTPPSVVCSCRC